MKIYLLTSNKYTKSLCPINVHFLNKYWPNQDITIVGYEDVLELKELPDNVNVACVGTQADFGSTWTNALIPYFKQAKEEYFTLIFDDHILMNQVPLDKIAELEEQFINKKAQKAMIGGGISLDSAKTFEDNKNLLEFAQYIDYRMSLHPAIWSKEYFLKYLKPNLTSWDFELVNDNRARFDGATILNYNYNYPSQPHLYSYLELYTKGQNNIVKLTPDISKELISELEQSIKEKKSTKTADGLVVAQQSSARFFNEEDIKYIWERTK
jgi:hypothetical protein